MFDIMYVCVVYYIVDRGKVIGYVVDKSRVSRSFGL